MRDEKEISSQIESNADKLFGKDWLTKLAYSAGYMDGIAYADNHPNWEEIVKRLREVITNDLRNDRWTAVEEDLPPYGEQVLVYAEEDPDHEMWWSERYTEDKAKFMSIDGVTEYEIMTDKNGFASMRDENNEPLQVSHWRKIKPPVLSNSGKTGKDLKGGEQ